MQNEKILCPANLLILTHPVPENSVLLFTCIIALILAQKNHKNTIPGDSTLIFNMKTHLFVWVLTTLTIIS